MSANSFGPLLLLVPLFSHAPEARTLSAVQVDDSQESDGMEYSLAYQWLDSPSERKVSRLGIETEHHDLAKSALPNEWKAVDHESCLVVHNADRRHVAFAEDLVEGVFEFLEDHFGFIGEGEYVRRPVFRIYSDKRERDAFDPYPLTIRTPEIRIVRHKLNDLNKPNASLLAFWFSDRSMDMQTAIPEWLKIGLSDLFEETHMKGKKITFISNGRDLLGLRLALEAGTGIKTEELFRLHTEDAWSDYRKSKNKSTSRVARTHARVLLEYLLVGKGASNKAHKSIISDYLKSLQVSLARSTAEMDQVAKASEPERPQTVGHEQKILKLRRKKIAEIAELHLEYACDATFRDWTAQDWERLDKAILREL